nr:MAG TPA: hypothetical protein [Caudoviricetes sp.]
MNTNCKNQNSVKLTVKEEIREVIGTEIYSGDYEVIPKVREQILETAKKTMKEDMKVLAIPFSLVDNTAGGQTITIGG